MINQTSGIIKGIITTEKESNGSISLHVKDVNISSSLDSQNFDNLTNTINMNTDFKNKITPKFYESLLERSERLFNKNNLFIRSDKDSKIIEMIKEKHNGNITELFSKSEDTLLINSPLESNNLINSELKNSIIEILNYNLTINLIMIYFILMLIFIFTIKYVINKETFSEKILNLPLGFKGKYLQIFLIKIITAWQASNILWIYFILFFLLFFSCSSTYAIYGCLFVLK